MSHLVRANFLWLIDQQFAARLFPVKPNQAMPAIDENHAVAQVRKFWRRLPGFGLMAINREQVQNQRVIARKWRGIADGDLYAVVLSGQQHPFDFIQSCRTVQLEQAKIFVVDQDLLAGDAQKPVNCRLVLAPGGY